MNTRIRRLAVAPMAAAAIFGSMGVVSVALAPAAIAAPATPSASDLQTKLQSALGGNAGELESGDASGLGAVRDRISQIPGYHWDVSGPVSVNGNTLSATLHSRLGTYDYPVPLTWKNIGGTWKLSTASQQQLIGIAGMR